MSERKKLEYGGLPLMAIDALHQPWAGEHLPATGVSRSGEELYTVNLSWLKSAHNIRAGFDADLQDSAETQYQTNSSGNITNAGGFRFAQGTTLLSGGPAAKRLQCLRHLLLGLPQDAGQKSISFRMMYFSKTRPSPCTYATGGRSLPS
jgi:hypothetical protein